MKQNSQKIVNETSQDSESWSASKRKLNIRNLKMRRRRESYRNVRLSYKDKSRLNSIAKSKKNWNSNVSPKNKDAMKLNCVKKKLKLSKRNSSARLRRSWKPNNERSRDASARWTARTKSADSAWRKRTIARRKRARSRDSRSRRRSKRSKGGKSRYSRCRESSSRSARGRLRKRGSSSKIEGRWKGWKWREPLRKNSVRLKW